MDCTLFHLTADGILFVCEQEGSACASVLSPTATVFDANTTYSWGSAVLASTYRELCRTNLDHRCGISSCITLLQVSITLFYYIHSNIHNTSLVCLLFVYFLFIYRLGRDFTWGDPILGKPAAYLAPLVPHALLDGDADVVVGDVA